MRPPHPALAWLLGWLLPGAGHLYLGQRARGLVLGGTLVGCFAAGVLLGGSGTVAAALPYYRVLQAGAGLPAAAAWGLGSDRVADVAVSRRETGMLYTLVPALLNLVVAMDAAARAAGARPGEGPLPAPTPPPPPPPPAREEEAGTAPAAETAAGEEGS